MNSKYRLFKHTFIVLGIMCCILLGSSSIIYAINDFNTSEVPSTPGSEYASASTTVTSGQPQSADSSLSAESSSSSAEPSFSSAEPSSSDESTKTNAPSNEQKEAKPDSQSPSQSESSSKSENKTDTGAAPASVTISAVGDIMAHQGNLNNAYSPKTGTYDFTGFLEYVKPYLSKADLTIGNFETVTAGPKTGYTSYPSFNTPDAILSALSGAGFDILSTANNHCLDRGITGLSRTIEMIKNSNMINVGSSTNGSNKYVIKEVNGVKLGILAYSGMFNGLDRKLSAEQKNTYISPINEQQMQKDIKAAKDAEADAVIVIVHWGTEYQREPNSTQKTLAKKLISWGADIILGSHPHVIQKSEIIKVNGRDKYIIYSMGNFISGYRRVDKANRPNKVFTEDGVIVNLQLEKAPDKGVVIKAVDYVPTWVDKYYVNNRPVFKIIPIPDINNISGKYITDYNRPYIQQSYKNTMGIMEKIK